MDWTKLYFGKLDRKEIQACVVKEDWQKIRLDMKGKTLDYKYATLCWWIKHKDCSREAQVQVTNYVTALSRGGLIKPEAYQI
jgi:hypothetical protein